MGFREESISPETATELLHQHAARMTGPRRILVRDMGPNYRDACWPWRYVAVVSDDERWFGSDDSIDGAVADLRRQSPDFSDLPVDPGTYGPGADDRCDGR
jgi:hypothetical protein